MLSKLTVPSFSAKSVSSLPLPTLFPGKNEVPLWRIKIDPALTFCKTIRDTQISKFDTIVCLDVLEHLSDPASQIKIFNEIMDSNSIALFNWYFYKGEKNEYPFHIDDSQIIEKFFETLQSNFLEVFHPILITTRAYKKN